MILRKPYAFLMKHFKKINFVLFLLTLYIFIETIILQGYTSDYAAGNTVIVDTITSFFKTPYFISLVLIVLIAIILLYLLKRKDKPIKTYVIVILEYLIFLVLSIYLRGYFNDFYINGYDKAFARTINGFVLIFSIPQYVILLLLFIRFIGLDLKSFGFHKDKEFLTSEEDREEVEVEVGVDPNKIKRTIKKTLREILYFIKEHKLQISLIAVVVVTVFSFIIYNSVYLTNKVFKMGEKVSSNNYTFEINNSYITTRNYRGDTIKKDKSYVIIDVDVTNLLNSNRTLDIERFTLLVDGISYTPTTNYNEQFDDLGTVFKGQILTGKQTDNYFLIFEIKNPNKDSNFILRYQDLTTHSKLIRVRLAIKDISSFVVRNTKNIKEAMEIIVNKNRTQVLTVNSYELGNSFPYTYEVCNYNECYIEEGITNVLFNRKVLYLKVSPKDSVYSLLNDVIRYGKVRYVVNGNTYEEISKTSISKKYRGNYLYLDVNGEIERATSVELVLTIRNNQYIYKLK